MSPVAVRKLQERIEILERSIRVIKFVIIIFIKCNILYGARFAA